MIERMPELVIELGERVLDGIDKEDRARIQAFAKWNTEATEIRREVLSDADHVMGPAFMRRLLVGLGTLEPPMPAAAKEPGPFTIDRTRPLVAAIEPATPAKPKRTRRTRKAKVPTGDAA
jgi:hypothetical protein